MSALNKISVISLIAYDYEMLFESIPCYIDFVDEVILGLDRNRKTWAGNEFEIPESFFERIKVLDRENKIRIVEAEFYQPGTSAKDLDTRERNLLSAEISDGSWIVSVDADEILLNVQPLVDFLRTYNEERVCIYGNWITLFKAIGEKLFVIENNYEALERFPLATKKRNAFTYCRKTEQNIVVSPVFAVHASWARTRSELERKLLNWGHRDDFVVEQFLKKWDHLSIENIAEFVDFHPFDGPMWQRLSVVDKSELEKYSQDLLAKYLQSFSWESIHSQAKAALYEGKVIQRDAIIASLKAELEQLKATQSQNSKEDKSKSGGLLGKLFQGH